MTHRERFVRVLTGRSADRVPFIKVFGGTNAIVPEWEKDCPGIGGCIDQKLQFEGEYRGWQICSSVNFWLSRVGPTTVLEETDERIVQRLGDGTVQIAYKGGDYHQHTVEWPVKTKGDWERIKREHLAIDDPSRFGSGWPAEVAKYRERTVPLQLTHGGVYGFARTLMGDERLAYAFYDEPELVHDLMDTFTDVMLALWEKMTASLAFDLIECWEDMASRNGCLISPATFREFMKPNYEKIAAFARSKNIPIILVDSDGYIADLVLLMLESGVTAMYPFEVQAGNDLAAILKKHPSLGAVGGLNKNVMAQSKSAIDAEMDRARNLIRNGRFIPGPDHFVLSDVPWEHYRYFMERLRDVVMTTPVEGKK